MFQSLRPVISRAEITGGLRPAQSDGHGPQTGQPSRIIAFTRQWAVVGVGEHHNVPTRASPERHKAALPLHMDQPPSGAHLHDLQPRRTLVPQLRRRHLIHRRPVILQPVARDEPLSTRLGQSAPPVGHHPTSPPLSAIKTSGRSDFAHNTSAIPANATPAHRPRPLPERNNQPAHGQHRQNRAPGPRHHAPCAL